MLITNSSAHKLKGNGSHETDFQQELRKQNTIKVLTAQGNTGNKTGARSKIKTCRRRLVRKTYTLKISVIESPVIKDRLQKEEAILYMENKVMNKSLERCSDMSTSLVFLRTREKS